MLRKHQLKYYATNMLLNINVAPNMKFTIKVFWHRYGYNKVLVLFISLQLQLIKTTLLQNCYNIYNIYTMRETRLQTGK